MEPGRFIKRKNEKEPQLFGGCLIQIWRNMTWKVQTWIHCVMITCQHICKLIMKSKETLEASGKPWKTLPLHQHLSTICLSTYFLTFKPNSLSSNNLDFLVLILILVCGKKNWLLGYGKKWENYPKMVSKLLTIKPKHILKLVFWIISPGAQRQFFLLHKWIH